MKKNKTCEFKYNIGCTTYCDIGHDGHSVCTDIPSRCKDAKLIDSRKTARRYYSFEKKQMVEI
jgi:hypothetical protein